LTPAGIDVARRRFVATLRVVRRQADHLAYSRDRLFSVPIDAAWVLGLETAPELAERLEAFVSRFGRMQDTAGEKLIPRWLAALAENPGSHIENLSRAERLNVLSGVDEWLELRKLRNRLIHEYMEDAAAFAADLNLARDGCAMLFEVFNNLLAYARDRMAVPVADLPAASS
jgi:hypothetical protein